MLTLLKCLFKKYYIVILDILDKKFIKIFLMN